MTTWTYGGYWNAVLGSGKSAAQVVNEFKLLDERRGVDEWLGTAEAEAWRVGGVGGDMPAEWQTFHQRALDELMAELDA